MFTQMRLATMVVAFVAALPAHAAETAQQPWISGDVWVAFAIVGVLLAVVILMAMGSYGLEKRDAKLGRRDDDEGGAAGLGMF